MSKVTYDTYGLNTRTAKAVFTTVDNYKEVRRNYG